MEETTTTVRRCSLCGEEGHIRSNRLFHPIEEVSIVVEEIPTEDPILDTPIEAVIEEPILDTPIEAVIEEPILDTPIEAVIEEPILDTPLTIEIPTEEVVIKTPPTPVVKRKTVFNTLNYSKKKPTEYHQLKVGR